MRRRAAALAAAVVAATALAACGSSTPAQAMRSWASAGSFAESVVTLLGDAKSVHHEIAFHRHPIEIRTACDELYLDANGSNTDELPTPDGKLTALLSAAYDRLVQAAVRCDAVSTDPRALAAVDAERHRGVGLLIAAVLREEAVAGRSLGIRGLP